jgi:hypothetical protein
MDSFTPYLVKIHLVRTSNSLENTDDTIKIRKNLTTGEFELTYCDPNEHCSTHVHTLRTLFHSTVNHHLNLLFKSLSIDDEPFHQVQFTLPAMPRILVNVEKFKDAYYRDHFMNLINNALDQITKVELDTFRKDRPTSSTSMKWETTRTAREQVDRVLGESVDRYFHDFQRANETTIAHEDSDMDQNPPPAPKKRRSTRLASSGYGSPRQHLSFD